MQFNKYNPHDQHKTQKQLHSNAFIVVQGCECCCSATDSDFRKLDKRQLFTLVPSGNCFHSILPQITVDSNVPHLPIKVLHTTFSEFLASYLNIFLNSLSRPNYFCSRSLLESLPQHYQLLFLFAILFSYFSEGKTCKIIPVSGTFHTIPRKSHHQQSLLASHCKSRKRFTKVVKFFLAHDFFLIFFINLMKSKFIVLKNYYLFDNVYLIQIYRFSDYFFFYKFYLIQINCFTITYDFSY